MAVVILSLWMDCIPTLIDLKGTSPQDIALGWYLLRINVQASFMRGAEDAISN